MGDREKHRKHPPTPAQLLAEIKALKKSHSQLRTTVGKLRSILQVDDNWHSHVTKWIGSVVRIVTDSDYDDAGQIPIHGILRWTDRYTIGIERVEEENPYEEIINKGHIVRIRQA